jgi:hypothetical protein
MMKPRIIDWLKENLKELLIANIGFAIILYINYMILLGGNYI